MTAPPNDYDGVRAGWIGRLGRIDSHITQAFVHQHLWKAMVDEVVRVNPSVDGQFLASYNRLYAEHAMMTVRRLADADPASDSLWRLWEAIKSNPACATRADYIALAIEHVKRQGAEPGEVASVARQSDRHFTETFGAGAHVDRVAIQTLQDELTRDAARVKHFVDTRIAHIDPERPTAAQAIDLSEINKALDDIAASANSAHRLLDRQFLAYGLVAVPPTWRASLRDLFPRPT